MSKIEKISLAKIKWSTITKSEQKCLKGGNVKKPEEQDSIITEDIVNG